MARTFATVNDLIGALSAYPDTLPVYGEGNTLCGDRQINAATETILEFTSRHDTIFQTPTVERFLRHLSLFDREAKVLLNGKPITDVIADSDPDGAFIDLWAKE